MDPPDIDHLYYQGSHYDQRYEVITEDIPFWIRRAEEYGDPILELAIGTGRVAIPMAKRGFKVTGIDISDSMMDVGKKKATREGVDIEWVVGDIRDFQLDRRFNLIIFPLNTICHLLKLEDLESCLSCVKAHMAPTGGFVIDAFVPDQERLARDPTEKFFNAEYQHPDGKGTVKIFESNEYDPARQVNRVRFYYQIPGRTKELVEELNMRMYFPLELDALLKHNGFTIQAKFGDYDDAPFGPKSPKQMVVCSLQE